MATIAAAAIAAGAAYYSADQSKKQAEKNRKAAAAPSTQNSQTTPYSPYAQNLNTIATDSLANYTRMRDNPTPPPRRSYSTGQKVAGASELENQLANSAGQRAMGGNRLLDTASGSLENLYGGGNHPLLQGAYDSAQNFTNPFLDEQVARQQRGSGSRASGLAEGLFGEWAGANTMNAGNAAYNQYYTQGDQAPTNLTDGGDIFGGMTSSGGGKQGIGAEGYRIASGGGGGAQAGPKSKLQEAYDAEMLRTMLGEYQDAESNPYIQQQIDIMKRDADAAYASRNAQINQSADGLGRFGSSPWMALNKQNEGIYNQEYLDRAGDLRFENYGMERGIMQQTLDRMLAQNNAEMSDRTARAGIGASSRSVQAGIDAQERMARDQNKLGLLGLLGQMEGQNQDYMGNLLGTQTQAGLSALGIQGQLGQSAAGNQISALGLAPGISDSYYTGYGVAGGLAGQVRQGNQSAQSANNAAAAAAANARYQDDMARWSFDRENQWDNLNNLYNLSMGPAQAFGTTQGTASGQQSGVALPSPWASALTTGLGTYLAFQNTQTPAGGNPSQNQPRQYVYGGLPVSGSAW